MKVKRIMILVLVLIVSISAVQPVSAKEVGNDCAVIEGQSIRVVDYETYLHDIEVFEENVKKISDTDMLKENIEFQNSDEVSERLSSFQSMEDSNTIMTLLYDGMGGVYGRRLLS